MQTEKNEKGRLNKRDKYRKKVVKRWVIKTRQKHIDKVVLLYLFIKFISYYL